MALLVCAALAAVCAAAPTIHVYFFDAPGCRQCAAAERTVRERLKPDPQVALYALDITKPRDFELAHALLTVAGLSSGAIPQAPGLLVGHTYLTPREMQEARILAAVDGYRTTGTADILPQAARLGGRARYAAPEMFRRWGVLPVVLAGLLDGINPCAIATLVFFVAFLAARGSARGAIVVTGLSFAAGVFAAYFAFGVGLLHSITAVEAFPTIRRVLYGAIALGCAGLAAVSVTDWRALRAGDVRGVRLELPRPLRQRVHSAVRAGVSGPAVVASAAMAGAIVSALELACTGQTYVPALMYMASMADTRVVALRWLLIYDLLFVLPLLVVLALAGWGVSSRGLARAARRHAPATKLLLAAFFALCAFFFASRAWLG
ncbi:MAG: hypothetical protein H5T86_02290 [Armatimonadetes bacterium]|nr:hypothetical protein [Armatimonadota bacterium]